MAFHLKRVRDGKGDDGSRSEAIAWNEDGTFKEVVDHRPTLGCSMLVGSLTARSYSSQDYWLTTTVTEIIESIENEQTTYMKFRTGNSVYEWWNGIYPKDNAPLNPLLLENLEYTKRPVSFQDVLDSGKNFDKSVEKPDEWLWVLSDGKEEQIYYAITKTEE